MMRVPLQSWIDQQLPADDTQVWPIKNHVLYLRDTIGGVVSVGLTFGQRCDEVAFVISTHRSKGFDLPVVRFDRPDLGASFVVRDNFHNTKLSVMSRTPITDDLFPFLFHTVPPQNPGYAGDELSCQYFEGFPSHLIFGYQATDPRRWSANISDHYAVWTTLFVCMRALGAIKPMRWGARDH